MPIENLRPLFTERSAAKVRPGLAMSPAGTASRLVLDADAVRLLWDGLGFYDMEIRWVAHLDDTGVLRLWRSWTGHQIYQARAVATGTGTTRFVDVTMEQHPDRYTGKLADEPGKFERVLISTINHLRRFRAGHTPYGPSPSTGPAPDPWPMNHPAR